jgi:hypothetical protein
MEQNQPAPQFEQQRIVAPPAPVRADLPDLAAMAVELDRMKIEASVDAERTRPGLNGLFAFLLASFVAYVVAHFVSYQDQAFVMLTHPGDFIEPKRAGIALGIGLVVAGAVALGSAIAERRTRSAVRAYEEQLIALGGTPLPERGKPLA